MARNEQLLPCAPEHICHFLGLKESVQKERSMLYPQRPRLCTWLWGELGRISTVLHCEDIRRKRSWQQKAAALRITACVDWTGRRELPP